MTGHKKNTLALCLAIPMIVFYLGYLLYHSDDIQPTGFIQYDNVSYIAYAKQYLDADVFHMQYANPFNDREYDPVYFQPQTLFFAFLLKMGIPPGWILIPFTLLCSFICFRLLIGIYDHLVPKRPNRTLNIWLFAWGGGLLAIAGAIANLYTKQNNFLDGLFMLDPERGWWGLNLGRSLFFTCEAYYHALFLGCIYSLLKRKWINGFILIFLLSLSHPFTGIELIGIISLWCVVEFFTNRKEIPVWFVAGIFLVLCFHLWYYLFYLNRFADHRSVSMQYSLGWRLRFFRIIPAYCIVGALALAGMYSTRWKNFFSIKHNRLFACWFLVAFTLANHEVFMKAMQPVHFTRGYIWTSLFLLGLPALLQWNNYLQKRWGILAVGVFAGIFFMDNFLWILNNVYAKATAPYATYINAEQQKVFEWLNKESSNKTLIVSNDNTIAYLSTIYSKAYSWYSHPYTTPFSVEKRAVQDEFFLKGNMDSSWKRREIDFVLRKTDTIATQSVRLIPVQKTFETDHYIVLKYIPSGN